MSEAVITGAAELGAGGVVVVGVAHDSYPEDEAGRGAIVGDGVPLFARQDDP